MSRKRQSNLLALCGLIIVSITIGGGCSAVDSFVNSHWRSSQKTPPGETSTAATNGPPPVTVDPRILDRKGIKPNSGAADRLSKDEANARQFESHIRQAESQVHESVLPAHPLRFGERTHSTID
jgi:hypothetical protein